MIKRGLTWLWLMTKRLYKKPSFLALLLLIPLLAFGYHMVAQQDSGVVTLALACEDPADPLANEMIERLMKETKLVRYLRADSPEDAKQMVLAQRADGAWIFPAQLQKLLNAYTKGDTPGSFIQVIEGTPSLALTLSREKLGGTVFSYTARAFYLQYLRSHAPELASVPDAQLMQSFDSTAAAETLFSFTTIHNTAADGVTYLTAPLRGMLAAVAVLCALACALWYTEDRERGAFVWISAGKQGITELLLQALCAGNAMAAVGIALTLSGTAVAFWREVLLYVLMVIGCAGFGALLRVLCPGKRAFAACIPVLAVWMLLACPVFVQVDLLQPLGCLLPVSYYISGAYDTTMLAAFMLYDSMLIGAYFLCKRFLHR